MFAPSAYVTGSLRLLRCCNTSAYGEIDISRCKPDVRSTPKSGHVRCKTKCPLWANSGHHGARFTARLRQPSGTLEVRLSLRQRCLIGPTGRRVLTVAPEMIQHQHADRRRKVVSVAAVVDCRHQIRHRHIFAACNLPQCIPDSSSNETLDLYPSRTIERLITGEAMRVISQHTLFRPQYERPTDESVQCPLYPRKRTCAVQLGMLCANSGHCVELFKDRVSFHRFNALANPSTFIILMRLQL